MNRETAGFKGFGKSVAHILCAVQPGRVELCDPIFDFRGDFYGVLADQRRPSVDWSLDFSDIGDCGAYDPGDVFQTWTPIGTDYRGQNKIDAAADTKTTGGIKDERIF